MSFAFTSCKKKADAPVNDINIEEVEFSFEDDGAEIKEEGCGH